MRRQAARNRHVPITDGDRLSVAFCNGIRGLADLDALHRVLLFELCDSEVEDLHGVAAALIGFEPDVVRFEVTVDDALLMRLLHSRTNLFKNIERPSDRKILFFVKYFAQRAAV